MSQLSLREAKDKIEAIEGIKRGIMSMKRNAGTPAAKFFREFFAEKGIARYTNASFKKGTCPPRARGAQVPSLNVQR
jgi:hypothetical protein